MRPRPAARPAPAELLALAGAVAVIAVSVLSTGDLLGADHDWLTAHLHHRIARDALLDGILPTWAPWLAGGFPLAGHPEAPFPSPLLLPTLLLGEALGPKVGIVGFAAAAAGGTWALARRLGLGPVGRTGAALVLVASSWLTWCVADGNYVELHWLLFPGMLAGLLGTGPVGVLGAGALLALAVFDGNVAVLTMGVGLVLLLALLPPGPGRAPRLQRPLRLAAAGLVAAVLAAGKLPPLVSLLLRDRRHIDRYADAADAFYGPASLLHALVGLDATPGPYPLSRVAVGPLVLGLALLGLAKAPRAARPWLAGGGLGALLAMGPAAPVDLFGLLWRLPLLGSVRHPAKAYDLLVVLAVAMLAGLGLDALAGLRRRARPLGSPAAALVLGLALLPVGHRLPGLLHGAFTLVPPAATTGPFRQLQGRGLPRYEGRPAEAEAYHAYLRGEGVLDWKPNVLSATAAQPDLHVDAAGTRSPVVPAPGPASLEGGRIVGVHPRADGLDIDVLIDTGALPATLSINQDADPCLVSSAGPVTAADGRATVQLTTPASPVTLRCRPPGLWAGLAVQGLGWLALGAWWLRAGWLRRRRAGPGSARPPSRREAPARG